MPKEIIISSEDDGLKPKNFLKKKLDVPFYKIITLIKEKRITLNKKKIKQDDVLRSGDIIKIWLDDIQINEKVKYQKNAQNLGLECIFDNQDFAVFNKTSGIVVQGSQEENISISLHLAWYKQHIKDNTDFEYFHAHRLDKDTSGCIVIAKNINALRELNRIFRDKDIIKQYICLCCGIFENKKGRIEQYMLKNPQGSREKMRICSKSEKDSKLSISEYDVIGEYEYKNEQFSLVKVNIKTGITHQIRCHMKFLGHPVVMDSMYGNSVVNTMFADLLNRQFLHAEHIEFSYNGKKNSFCARLTQDLENTLKKINKIL